MRLASWGLCCPCPGLRGFCLLHLQGPGQGWERWPRLPGTRDRGSSIYTAGWAHVGGTGSRLSSPVPGQPHLGPASLCPTEPELHPPPVCPPAPPGCCLCACLTRTLSPSSGPHHLPWTHSHFSWPHHVCALPCPAPTSPTIRRPAGPYVALSVPQVGTGECAQAGSGGMPPGATRTLETGVPLVTGPQLLPLSPKAPGALA